jgi:membrane fusion protein (multidrug efflux system)
MWRQIPVVSFLFLSLRQVTAVLGERCMKIAGRLALMTVLSIPGCGKSQPEPAAAQAPVPVKVATVFRRDVPELLEAVGQTRGSIEVEIRARVEGFIDRVLFDEGKPVRTGEVLYEIDPKQYVAAVNRSKGVVAQAQADLAKARQDVARYKPLVAQNAISREEYETSVSMEQAAVAKVDAAKAALESNELDLSYTKVLAPIDGLAAKTEVKVGALVGRGQSTLLTTLSKNDPIHCRFSLSERDYLALARRVRESGQQRPEFEMILSDGSLHPHKGSFVFIERQIDPTTGSIMVEATFPNPEGIVRPGQFARVRVPVAVRKDALLVPQRAVSELQATYSVGAVTPDNKVEMRPVRTGARVGGLWVIESGLKPGDRVIVEGLQKVRNGSLVVPTAVELDENGNEVRPPAVGEVK